MSQINVELGATAGTSRNLGHAAVRGLAAKSSGTIAFSDLRGKSSLKFSSISYNNIGGMDSQDYWVITLNVTSSGSWTSSGSLLYVRGSADNQTILKKVSQSRYELYCYHQYYGGYAKVRFTVTNGSTSQTLDTVELSVTGPQPPSSCFTGDSLVRMADGSLRRIDTVQVGEEVRTAVGTARVWKVHMPKLAHRQLVSFDGRAKTSAEHSFWTRDRDGRQWWSTRDMQQWIYEGTTGQGPWFGEDNLPFDLTNRLGEEWDFATETGWETTAWQVHEGADPETQLYNLRLDDGGSYFVDGFLVSSRASEDNDIDWLNFVWE